MLIRLIGFVALCVSIAFVLCGMLWYCILPCTMLTSIMIVILCMVTIMHVWLLRARKQQLQTITTMNNNLSTLV
jgi:hypothetical protein